MSKADALVSELVWPSGSVTSAVDMVRGKLDKAHTEIVSRLGVQRAICNFLKAADAFLDYVDASQPQLNRLKALLPVAEAMENPIAFLFETDGGRAVRAIAVDLMRKLGHPIPAKTLSRGTVETCKFIRAKCLIVLGQVKKEEDRLKVLINGRFREMEQALDDLDKTELAEVLRTPREELRAAAVEYGTVRIVDGALQRGSIVEAISDFTTHLNRAVTDSIMYASARLEVLKRLAAARAVSFEDDVCDHLSFATSMDELSLAVAKFAQQIEQGQMDDDTVHAVERYGTAAARQRLVELCELGIVSYASAKAAEDMLVDPPTPSVGREVELADGELNASPSATLPADLEPLIMGDIAAADVEETFRVVSRAIGNEDVAVAILLGVPSLIAARREGAQSFADYVEALTEPEISERLSGLMSRGAEAFSGLDSVDSLHELLTRENHSAEPLRPEDRLRNALAGALPNGSNVEAAFLVVSVGLKKGLYLIGERTIAVGDLSGVIRRKSGVIISPGDLDGVIRELAALGVVEHSKKSGTVSINRDFRSDRRSPFALRNALYLLIGPVT